MKVNKCKCGANPRFELNKARMLNSYVICERCTRFETGYNIDEAITAWNEANPQEDK